MSFIPWKLVSTILLIGLAVMHSGSATGQGNLTCGLKPLSNLGCRVGRCVDGAWEQICDTSPRLSCGLKPLPNLGCRIGRCVDGVWEQVCN